MARFLGLTCWLVLLGLGHACAQVAPPANAASAPLGKASAALSERVQQQADNVFKWIKVHGDKPRKADLAAAATADVNRKVANKPAAPAVALVKASEPALKQADVSVEAPAVEVAPPPVASALPEPTIAQPAEKPLKALAQPKPEFPEDIMASLGTGSVKVRFMVQPDGTVASPEVLSTSHRRLNKAALDAIKNWRFEPVPVARVAQVELGFKLD